MAPLHRIPTVPLLHSLHLCRLNGSFQLLVVITPDQLLSLSAICVLSLPAHCGRSVVLSLGRAHSLQTGPMAMERLPDKVLLAIFSFLGDHREILKCATVCKKWRGITADSRLWQCVSLRPDFNGLNVSPPVPHQQPIVISHLTVIRCWTSTS